jgi:hypothetical protein
MILVGDYSARHDPAPKTAAGRLRGSGASSRIGQDAVKDGGGESLRNGGEDLIYS